MLIGSLLCLSLGLLQGSLYQITSNIWRCTGGTKADLAYILAQLSQLVLHPDLSLAQLPSLLRELLVVT